MNYHTRTLFFPYLPPSANSRLGRGKYGNSYLKNEARNFQTILERELIKRHGNNVTIKKKHLWRISFFVLGDWASYETYTLQGCEIKNAIGNCGEEEAADLDNMAKDIVDALKKAVQNDDRYTNEIHQYKIQWPQKKGVIVSFSENRHYEATDLVELGIPEDLMREILQ